MSNVLLWTDDTFLYWSH